MLYRIIPSPARVVCPDCVCLVDEPGQTAAQDFLRENMEALVHCFGKDFFVPRMVFRTARKAHSPSGYNFCVPMLSATGHADFLMVARVDYADREKAYAQTRELFLALAVETFCSLDNIERGLPPFAETGRDIDACERYTAANTHITAPYMGLCGPGDDEEEERQWQEFAPRKPKVQKLIARIYQDMLKLKHEDGLEQLIEALGCENIRDFNPDENIIPPKLEITADCQVIIHLTPPVELSIPPLARALYILLLTTPGGVRLKELSAHRDRLAKLYTRASPKADLRIIGQTIDAFCDGMDNRHNEMLSAIRTALARQVDPRLLKHYSPQKESRQAGVKVKLPKDLIDSKALAF